ncbi:hypothetical protein OEZ85_006040 [Tetradesmus obliquus]|uniref:Uncharacterized protein n=1 Tax=Tetradesmus obliquus TaxID=3088 RepID=A0ABY8UIQ3_TETOB|nr:hypothetical protein OEZ85_006040 [Tetradesmus obliquus]
MMWVGENYPGWEAPNKAKQIGLGTVKQARGMVKLYWALHHLTAGLSAGDMGGAYTSAASGAEAKSLPDKGARPDRDPQTSGSIRAALEAAEGEREELKLAVPGYSRHLAALAKEKNKEKGSKSG